MNSNTPLLLVEDNEDDVILMKRAIKLAGIANPVMAIEDGQEAIDYLKGVGKYGERSNFPLPGIVLLDIKLPKLSGHEVLNWIREVGDFKSLIVVIITSSNQVSDIQRAYDQGANSYIVKPGSFEELTEFAKAFKIYWLQFNQIPSGNLAAASEKA